MRLFVNVILPWEYYSNNSYNKSSITRSSIITPLRSGGIIGQLAYFSRNLNLLVLITMNDINTGSDRLLLLGLFYCCCKKKMKFVKKKLA